MTGRPSPISKQKLSDRIASEIKRTIDANYQAGDRLPTIAEMARRFEVGSPTLREALKKLEAFGVVNIKHGSGTYVGEEGDSLFLSNPISTKAPSKKILLDLIEARILIEVDSVAKAAGNATDVRLERAEALLAQAEKHMDDDKLLGQANMDFHRELAAASGNAVIEQVMEVLTNLFFEEQRTIQEIHGSREKDHEEHVSILHALQERDKEVAAQRMRDHLEGVRDVVRRWDPDTT